MYWSHSCLSFQEQEQLAHKLSNQVQLKTGAYSFM